MAELFEIIPTSSGQVVSPSTALAVSSVYACVRLLAGSLASLPLKLYRLKPDGSRESIRDESLWWLFNEQPHPRWSAASAWEYWFASVLLRGDAFAWIDRAQAAGRYEIKQIVPLPADSVVVEVEGDRLKYFFWFDGRMKKVDQDDMLHFPGLGFDGLRSMSVIQYGARNAIGIAMAADAHSGKFFDSGALQRFVLTQPRKLSPEQKEDLRTEFSARYGSGDSDSVKPIVLTEGTELSTISLSSRDAQLIESRQFQTEDVARAFGVPPFMIGHTEKTTSWGSGVETMGRGYLIFTLQPHITRFEQELNRKLFRKAGKFFEFQVDGLARADMKSRNDAYRQAIGGSQGPGWLTINEVRKFENLPPIEGGEKLYVQMDKANEAVTPPAGKE